MLITNANLHRAKSNKNDEFYTEYSTVEQEMPYYKEYFKGKCLYFNCDRPTDSSFWAYFHIHFAELGLRKIIATYCDISNPVYKWEYTGGNDADVSIAQKTLLGDYGSFQGCASLEILSECDTVVTNPPFSMFREFVACLMDNHKDFLILGNMNAVTYKEIYPYIQANKLWYGVSLTGTKCSFMVPPTYEGANVFIEQGIRKAKVNNAIWFTNIDHAKRHEFIPLTAQYDATKYIKYDNYDAIECARLTSIPCDYKGIIGVPITFLSKYNPEQFRIIKFRKGNDNKDLVYTTSKGELKQPYFRILIQRL